MPSPRLFHHFPVLVLGSCLLLFALVAAAVMRPVAATTELEPILEPVPGSEASARAVATRDRVRLGGSDEPVRVRLRTELPASRSGDSPWQLWIGRDMLDELYVEGPGWRSPPQRFFAPGPGEDVLPAGFAFLLPAHWQGPMVVELVVRSRAPATLQPRLLRQPQAMQKQQRSLAVASAIYASLFVLALVAFSLYVAARDHAYLALLAFTVSALALLLAINGHLYALPGLRYAGLWGVQGVWALLLLLSAAAVWLVQHYAELRAHAPRLHRASLWVMAGTLVLAGLCLLNLSVLTGPMRWLASLGWIAAAVVGVAAGIVAVQRRLWMSPAILAMIGALAFAGLMRELALLGVVPGGFWLRYGYQLALTGCAFLLTIALIGRIAHVRAERDRERLARDDSERRFEREAARAQLVQGLQQRLRELPPGDMEWAAFRMMFERLLPLLRLEGGVLVAYGYHGFDLLLAEPLASKQAFTDLLTPRLGMLKGLARTQAPLQLRLDGEEEDPDAALQRLHAVIPLPIRAPAWGVLVLQRGNGGGFSHDELALASDFGRLAVLHADEAATALNLRRSAELDSLTGALNRRTIDLWVARSFTDAHRSEQPVSVLFVDIDHFKAINDTYGHACGDICLRHVAETLRRELQPSDLLGRYGGEEFLVVLPGRNGDAGRQVGERIRAAIEREQIEWDGKSLQLTVSIGVAPRLPREHAPAAAVERADKALYVAKRGGRNRVSVAPAVFT